MKKMQVPATAATALGDNFAMAFFPRSIFVGVTVGTLLAACGSGGSSDLPDAKITHAIDAARTDGHTTFDARTMVDAAPMVDADTTVDQVIFDQQPAALGNDATATFAFHSSAPSTFTCVIDAGTGTSCTSPLSFSVTEGSHTLAVTATPTGGGVTSQAASVNWTVDLTAPDVTLVSGPNLFDHSYTPTFEFSSTDPTATFSCNLNSTGFVACTSPWIIDVTDGANDEVIQAVDAAGNISLTPVSVSWTVDNTGPTAANSTISSSESQLLSDDVATTTITFTVHDADDQPIPNQQVSLSATGTGNTFSPANAGFTDDNGVFTATMTSTSAGTQTITGTAAAMTKTVDVKFLCSSLNIFGLRTTRSVGLSPLGFVAADFNHDGTLDLASGVYDNVNTSVNVDLGTGGGAFAAPSTVTASTYIADVATADLNGDGVLDLAAISFGAQKVDVMFGKATNGVANGTFAAATTFATQSEPWSIALGDVDGINGVDIVASNIGSNSVSVMKNNGVGVFTVTNIATGTGPAGVALIDVDSDGDLDIVTANENGGNAGSVSVLLNNGAGSFGAPTSYAVGGNSARTLAFGDFNGDGNFDLAVAVSNSNLIAVLLGNDGTGGTTKGTFKAAVAYPSGASTSPFWVNTVDLNNDGVLDLVYANTGANTVGVRFGNGDGTFGVDGIFPVGASPQGLAIGDFDADGKFDVIASDAGDSDVSILLNVCAD